MAQPIKYILKASKVTYVVQVRVCYQWNESRERSNITWWILPQEVNPMNEIFSLSVGWFQSNGNGCVHHVALPYWKELKTKVCYNLQAFVCFVFFSFQCVPQTK